MRYVNATHRFWISAARIAILRRLPLERRQRLGERIYDVPGLNPLGCTRCALPFVSGETALDEECKLCTSERVAVLMPATYQQCECGGVGTCYLCSPRGWRRVK